MIEGGLIIPPRDHFGVIHSIHDQDVIEEDTDNAIQRECQLIQEHYPLVRRKGSFCICNFLGIMSVRNVAFVFIDFKLKLTKSRGISNLSKSHNCKQQSCQ